MDIDCDLYWLSFVGDNGFLGVAIVRAFGEVHAVATAWDQGINPGGEVGIVGPLPSDAIDEHWCNRLLTKEEALSIPAPSS